MVPIKGIKEVHTAANTLCKSFYVLRNKNNSSVRINMFFWGVRLSVDCFLPCSGLCVVGPF